MSLSEIGSYSIAGWPGLALLMVVGVYLPKYYAGHLGVGLAVVGGTFALVRMLDIGVDFAVGIFMDKTRTAIGRFRPWMLSSIPLLMISVYMLVWADPGVGERYLMGWLFVFYVGVSIYLLSMSAFAATLATDYNDRSKVLAWAQCVGIVGAVVVLSVPFIAEKLGYIGEVAALRAMGAYVLVALPASLLMMLFLTPERMAPETTRERFSIREMWSLLARPTMGRLFIVDLLLAVSQGPSQVLYLFFFHDARGFTIAEASSLLIFQTLSGLAGAPAAAWLCAKIGKHRTLIVTSVGFALAKAYLWFTPQGGVVYAAVGVFCLGALVASFTLLIRSMAADVGDEIRLEQGRERMGMVYALVTTTTKIGSAATVAVTFTLLQWFGFNAAPGAANSPRAIQGVEICYLWGPIVFVLLAAAVMFGYKLDAKRHAEIRMALDARDAAVLAARQAEAPAAEVTGALPAKP